MCRKFQKSDSGWFTFILEGPFARNVNVLLLSFWRKIMSGSLYCMGIPPFRLFVFVDFDAKDYLNLKDKEKHKTSGPHASAGYRVSRNIFSSSNLNTLL